MTVSSIAKAVLNITVNYCRYGEDCLDESELVGGYTSLIYMENSGYIF